MVVFVLTAKLFHGLEIVIVVGLEEVFEFPVELGIEFQPVPKIMKYVPVILNLRLPPTH